MCVNILCLARFNAGRVTWPFGVSLLFIFGYKNITPNKIICFMSVAILGACPKCVVAPSVGHLPAI